MFTLILQNILKLVRKYVINNQNKPININTLNKLKMFLSAILFNKNVAITNKNLKYISISIDFDVISFTPVYSNLYTNIYTCTNTGWKRYRCGATYACILLSIVFVYIYMRRHDSLSFVFAISLSLTPWFLYPTLTHTESDFARR